jgi:hypothetical protein
MLENLPDFASMDSIQYDETLNEISKELFTMDKELETDRQRLMQWALINLLLNKGLITQEEFTQSVEEATQFFKLLKRRKNLIDNPESTENA